MSRALAWMAACCVLLAWGGEAAAQEAWVSICHGYGCAAESVVRYDSELLQAVVRRLQGADSAAAERAILAGAIGGLYRVAGEQTVVAADRGGNFADEEGSGRMDCIDHSTSTTRLLQLLESRGALRFHRVLERERRGRFFQHYSAVIEELEMSASGGAPAVTHSEAGEDCACDAQAPLADAAANSLARRYVVDSWFVDNGEPAVVLPLADWLDGEGPNVQ
ncbi:hypothetical protein [Azoarcus olearius]|uniref:Hypothetical secreted protein n=1 Tax=Azoarcus sp. (strain BH72) TaxID=418699 RepID=A1K984_AZOSB|nr:hypothetical protein [Azoarcus olearius]CAL95389.1 hypothetical secreted protein [Azoarcus olearius]